MNSPHSTLLGITPSLSLRIQKVSIIIQIRRGNLLFARNFGVLALFCCNLFVSLVSPQAAIVNLSGYKSDLFNLNLGVHNLLAGRSLLRATKPAHTEEEVEDQFFEAGYERLEGEVVNLYAKWDEAFQR